MSDGPELNRRKVLGGVATIGAAGALGVSGTWAFFSDEETFANNTLTAGALDLKVDWEEHYPDWSPDESEGLEQDVVMTENDPENVPEGFLGLPDPEALLIAVAEEDLDTFIDNTSIEAYPDTDDDGIQDPFAAMPGQTTEAGVGYVCEDGADTPEDLDPRPEGALWTENEDTLTDEGEPAPLIDLADVKPGDFGELTLSYHLCDNDGYVWLTADNIEASENGLTEPEAKDEDEQEGVVELYDAIQTTWWYDTDGDNVLDEEAGRVDAMVLLDTSGSLNSSEANQLRMAGDQLVSDLLDAGDVNVGGIRFGGNTVTVDSPLTDTAFSFGGSGGGSGNTPLPPALDIADQHLDAVGRANAEQVIIVLTDGGPNYQNQVYSAPPVGDAPRNGTFSFDDADQAYDNGVGSGNVTAGELDETELVATNVKTSGGTDSGDSSRIVTVGIGDTELVDGTTLDDFLRTRVASTTEDHFDVNDPTALTGITETVAETAVTFTEEVIFRGSLRQALEALSTANPGAEFPGIPLDGDRSTEFDEIEGDATSDARECFEGSTTNYVGFAWYLPVNHANEIQTDSVQFDLSFYTEQCRHNDGSGQRLETPDTPDNGNGNGNGTNGNGTNGNGTNGNGNGDNDDDSDN